MWKGGAGLCDERREFSPVDACVMYQTGEFLDRYRLVVLGSAAA